MNSVIQDTFDDVDDQLITLKAIKGKAYAKVVSFVLTNYSMSVSIMNMLACLDVKDERQLDSACEDIAMVLNITGSHNVMDLCSALGLSEEQSKEALADGKRITLNSISHISRGLKHD